MKGHQCSYQRCGEPVLFTCNCGQTVTYLCDAHRTGHLAMAGAIHTLEPVCSPESTARQLENRTLDSLLSDFRETVHEAGCKVSGYLARLEMCKNSALPQLRSLDAGNHVLVNLKDQWKSCKTEFDSSLDSIARTMHKQRDLYLEKRTRDNKLKNLAREVNQRLAPFRSSLHMKEAFKAILRGPEPVSLVREILEDGYKLVASGNVSSGIDSVLTAVSILETQDELQEAAHVLENLAYTVRDWGDPRKAASLLQDSINLAELQLSRQDLVRRLLGLGELLFTASDFRKSSEALSRCANICQEEELNEDFLKATYLLISSCRLADHISQAIESCIQNANKCRELGFELYLANVQVLLADLYNGQGEIDRAIPVLEESAKIYRFRQQFNRLLPVLNSLSELYYVNQRPIYSIAILEEAVGIARQENQPDVLVEQFLKLAKRSEDCQAAEDAAHAYKDAQDTMEVAGIQAQRLLVLEKAVEWLRRTKDPQLSVYETKLLHLRAHSS